MTFLRDDQGVAEGDLTRPLTEEARFQHTYLLRGIKVRPGTALTWHGTHLARHSFGTALIWHGTHLARHSPRHGTHFGTHTYGTQSWHPHTYKHSLSLLGILTFTLLDNLTLTLLALSHTLRSHSHFVTLPYTLCHVILIFATLSYP